MSTPCAKSSVSASKRPLSRFAIKKSQSRAPSAGSGTPEVQDRRLLLSLLLASPSLFCFPSVAYSRASETSGDWSSPGLAAPVDDSIPKFFKTASGVKIQEIAAGRGDQEVQPGDAVLFDYVLRRANGYFIYATVEGVSFQPRDVPIGPVYFNLNDETFIPGLKEALIGMQPGAKRRALIPPTMGYISQGMQPQPPTYAAKRQLLNHADEPFIFEVQLLRVNP